MWRALAAHPGVTAYDTYGPTEASVDATRAEMTAGSTPVIGRPYGSARVHLVNERLEPVPPGTAGEIVIGGPGVGRGYLNRPGVTAGVFVPDPFGAPGERLYRTGDLGRYTADGQIEFLGRNDHQVKILGQRIEPEEVEAALRGHPAVTAAAVSAHRLGTDRRLQLVAHLVMAEGQAAPDHDSIRDHLAGRLPAAAVPALLVPVEALPMTPGGKLDRRALTVPDGLAAGPSPHRDLVPPRTGTERRVAAVWQEVLGITGIGVHDDFFALGGHSLLAVRLALQLSKEFGTRIPLAHLYTASTVAGQAARVAELPPHREAPDGRSVVPLGGTPGERPLVLVHPLGGTLFCYRDLLDGLTAPFEVYGVQGDVGGAAGPPATDLAALAGRYAGELAPVLGDRAPVIAGWSAGGVLAHELARALAGRGVHAHRLVLIDSHPQHAQAAEDTEDTEAAEAAAADLAALDALRDRVAAQGPGALLGADDADRLFATLGVDPEEVAGLDAATTATLMGFWRDMLAGLTAHRPAAFAGPAELLLARGDGNGPVDDRAVIAAWRELTGTLTVTRADGDHFQLLRRPWVKAVADALRGPTGQTGE
nr:thioesterase domain-containing protein [Streptomyces aidingensis]